MGYAGKVSLLGQKIRNSSINIGSYTLQVQEGIDEYSVGRGTDRDLVIDFPFSSAFGVSRHHCVLINGDRGLSVIDDSSSKGTFVDGRRLEAGEIAALTNGSLLGLGSVCNYRVKIENHSGLNGKRGLIGLLGKLLKA